MKLCLVIIYEVWTLYFLVVCCYMLHILVVSCSICLFCYRYSMSYVLHCDCMTEGFQLNFLKATATNRMSYQSSQGLPNISKGRIPKMVRILYTQHLLLTVTKNNFLMWHMMQQIFWFLYISGKQNGQSESLRISPYSSELG